MAVFKPLTAAGILTTTALSTRASRDWLGTAFGYRKLFIAATEFGKIYALDLGNGGKFVWTTYVVPLGGNPASDATAPKSLIWKKIAVFDKTRDGKILIMAVAQVEGSDVST